MNNSLELREPRKSIQFTKILTPTQAFGLQTKRIKLIEYNGAICWKYFEHSVSSWCLSCFFSFSRLHMCACDNCHRPTTALTYSTFFPKHIQLTLNNNGNRTNFSANKKSSTSGCLELVDRTSGLNKSARNRPRSPEPCTKSGQHQWRNRFRCLASDHRVPIRIFTATATASHRNQHADQRSSHRHGHGRIWSKEVRACT